jgi:hypothetical protein
MEGVKLNFEADTPYGVYRDTLILPADHNLTEHDIEQMMQARVANWVAALTAPPAEEPPAEEPPAEEPPQDG